MPKVTSLPLEPTLCPPSPRSSGVTRHLQTHPGAGDVASLPAPPAASEPHRTSRPVAPHCCATLSVPHHHTLCGPPPCPVPSQGDEHHPLVPVPPAATPSRPGTPGAASLGAQPVSGAQCRGAGTHRFWPSWPPGSRRPPGTAPAPPATATAAARPPPGERRGRGRPWGRPGDAWPRRSAAPPRCRPRRDVTGNGGGQSPAPPAAPGTAQPRPGAAPPSPPRPGPPLAPLGAPESPPAGALLRHPDGFRGSGGAGAAWGHRDGGPRGHHGHRVPAGGVPLPLCAPGWELGPAPGSPGQVGHGHLGEPREGARGGPGASL